MANKPMRWIPILLLAGVTSGCYTPYKDPRTQEQQDADRVAALKDLVGTYTVVDSRANPVKIDKVQFIIKGGYPALILFRKDGTEVFMDSGPSICSGGVGGPKNPGYRSVFCDYRDPVYKDVWYSLRNVTSPQEVKLPGLLGLTEGSMKLSSGYLLEVRGTLRNEMKLALRRDEP